jgi:hypothetical protein
LELIWTLISQSYSSFHIMSSSSSSYDVKDQVVEALSCVVDQAIAMVKAGMEGPSTRWSRLRRCYVNRHREVADEMMHYDYFTDESTVCEGAFSYA